MKHIISINLSVDTALSAEELAREVENNPLAVLHHVDRLAGFVLDGESGEEFQFFALDLLKR